MDFAATLKARLRTLRRHVESRAALADAIREANATLDPVQVASWLIRQAHGWFPAPTWVVVAPDVAGQLTVLADHNLTPRLGPSLWSVVRWVMQHGVELSSGDLTSDTRAGAGAAGTVLAFPLISRNQVIGVLAALDPAPSSTDPSLGPAVLLAVRALLEPSAIALDNAIALQRAEALSVTDDLTRLYNSRFLHQVLRRETKRAARSGRPLSLIFLDLDGFKQVNDHHGHLAGSRALVEAAAVVRSCARETDVVARFGGDEFSLILPETGHDGAGAVALRIRNRLRAGSFLSADGLAVRLTASIGVATLPDVATSADELLRAADMAMYKVKAAGKDGIHIATIQECR